MRKCKYTKAKEKWLRTRLKYATIYYLFNCTYVPIYEWDCNWKGWTTSNERPSLILERIDIIEKFIRNLPDIFFSSRKLSFKNKNISVEYQTVKTMEKRYLEELKKEGLI